MDQLRSGRAEREEQAQYLQSPDQPCAGGADRGGRAGGTVQLLNLAARRLFEGRLRPMPREFSRHGEAFAAGLENLKPGDGAILRMERRTGGAAAQGRRHRSGAGAASAAA